MFSYVASAHRKSAPTSRVRKAPPTPRAEPKRASRKGHVVVAGRYITSKHLESDFQLRRKVLGEGMSGSIRLAEHVGSGREFAVKRFSKHDLKGDRLSEVRTEVEIHLILDHPHIARCEGVYESDSDIRMVIEHLAGPDLFDKIVERGRFTEKDAAVVMRQMLLPVQYMHGHGLVHRDLKPDNFMYESQDTNFLKLIDLGLARRFDSTKDEHMSHCCGTIDYVAPEVFGGSYTEKADLWSLGIILYSMLCGGMPWRRDQKAVDLVRTGMPHYGPTFKCLSQAAQKFIKSLLSKDPSQRPSAADALLDPWFEASGAVAPSTFVSSSVLRSIRDFAKTSAMLQNFSTMTAWSCSREVQGRMREQFLALGADGNGALTLTVFVQAMTSAHMKAPEAEDLFRRLDVDGDGEIAFTEFIAAASPLNDLAVDTLPLSFGRFDVDGDGKITSQDLRAVLGSSFFKKHNVEEWLLEVGDSDGAASLEMISVFMRQCQDLTEDVNAACTHSWTRTRSISMTSLQSQDQAELIQSKMKFERAASQPEKGSLARVARCFSERLCVR